MFTQLRFSISECAHGFIWASVKSLLPLPECLFLASQICRCGKQFHSRENVILEGLNLSGCMPSDPDVVSAFSGSTKHINIYDLPNQTANSNHRSPAVWKEV